MQDYSIETFETPEQLEQWMMQNAGTQPGIWIKMAKKSSGITSVNHDQALDIMLCFGWIDGQRKGLDTTYFLQKFTPRRAQSTWSKRNIDKIAKLTAAGKMQPSGTREVEVAKDDGRWQTAYDSQKDMEIPEDFLQAVEGSLKARMAFENLNRTEKYAIAFRLATAKKPETRQRRMGVILNMLEKGTFR
jgi:uncharacterized protein YdeI (YjbR/CyaY-like superfamily)